MECLLRKALKVNFRHEFFLQFKDVFAFFLFKTLLSNHSTLDVFAF